MVTVVAIDPKETEKFFKTTAEGFEANLMLVDNLGQMPIDNKDIIIFHPRTRDMNPPWLTEKKIEDFNDFNFPEDAYYIFGSDFGNIINDIEINAPAFMEKARWVKIPTKKDFKSLQGHVALGIVLWERYKRLGKASL